MKLEKTTLMIILVVILCITGIIGYICMNNIPKNEVIVSEANENNKIYVHVKGEVKNPGLYEFEYGSRINDAIIKAGGETENADIDRVNLAKHLIDGTEVIVPNVLSRDSDYGEKVNINTANESRLQNINGVGEATAEKIIKYREENGGFNSIEEIMNIEGIGLKTFETMKEYICIN
jgi:competence protein ComEA